MKTMLKSMQMRKNDIPQALLPIFEQIVQTYEGNECDQKFMKAMEDHLTKEQRYRLYEQNGGCQGTGRDKERKSFALKHADVPLSERLKIFTEIFGRTAVLNEDNTIAVTFTCPHRYHKRGREKNESIPLPPIEVYFERCAGGRLYELQKALGVELKIKFVDITSLNEDFDNPVAYVFEVVG